MLEWGVGFEGTKGSVLMAKGRVLMGGAWESKSLGDWNFGFKRNLAVISDARDGASGEG